MCPNFDIALLFFFRFLTDQKAPKSRWAVSKILPTGANAPNESQTRTATCALLVLCCCIVGCAVLKQCDPLAGEFAALLLTDFTEIAQTHFFFALVLNGNLLLVWR